jgi:hypothetical protein
MMTRMERPIATVARAPATAGQPPVALAQEGAGARGRDRDLAEDLPEVAVAVPSGAATLGLSG